MKKRLLNFGALMLVVCATFALGACGEKVEEPLKPTVQKVISKPAIMGNIADITVQVGVPVEWTLDLSGVTNVGCRWGIRACEELGFDGFAIDGATNPSGRLVAGQIYVIGFNPTQTGEFVLGCVSMNMKVVKILVVGLDECCE
jgi:hypothetical protein